MEEDRSELFNSIKDFSQRKLKKVETKVKTGLGDEVIEKRTAKGLASSAENNQNNKNATPVNQNANRKLDLQVGLVSAGLMIGSNDVATRKDVLNDYGITHVLNLCPNETESFQFEDEYNYLEVSIQENVTKLNDILDKCLDFIEEGQKRGNCFVHCNTAKPGLSRSTAICIAYLIYKDKKSYADAFNDVKEARAFVRPSDWFAKQLQVYATEQGAKQKEEQVEDKFTAKKRKEIEEEKALLQKAVNLEKKKNLWNQKAEESQKQQLKDQQAKEKLIINKLKNNPQAFNENEPINNTKQIAGPRKLTSLVSIFQQKDDEPIKPINKVVLNTAPAKRWAPVSTPHLQRTVRPETKNFDFYSKVKKAKSKDFKRAESLRKSKSKLNCDNEKTDLNNNNINQKIDSKPSIVSATPPPPPPPPPMPIKSAPINKNNQIKPKIQPPAPPPPPPLPTIAKKPITNSPLQQTNKIEQNNKKVSSPVQSLTSSRTSSPQPSSNTSSRVSSPIPSNNTLINKPTTTKLNNGFPNKPSSPAQSLTSSRTSSPLTSPTPMQQSKLDPNRMNKFNNPNAQNPWLAEKIVDYSGKLNLNKVNDNQKSNEIVRNIPIKLEPNEANKEIIELEVEEEEIEIEESENEESEETESEQDEESEEESEEETESEEESESSEESSSSSSSEDDELTNEQPKTGGLTRSSTQQILNLIKSKNNDTLQGINEEDEDKEIDLLLNGLEKEGIENIDWSEFELSLDEIKEIINSNN